MHEICHVLYQLIQAGGKVGSPHLQAAITNRIQHDINVYLETAPDRNGDISLIETYKVVLKTMMRYVREQSPIIDKSMNVLGVEHTLEYDTGRGYSLFGYCDLYWETHGILRIRDHKSGEKKKTRDDALWSNQLLLYAVVVYKLTGRVPVGEMSYINTKDYVKKVKSYDEAYAFHTIPYSKLELDIYYEKICRTIETLLQCEPLPHYGYHCNGCAFQAPCLMMRKGSDPTPVLITQYKRVPRDSQKHARFTEDVRENPEVYSTD